MNKSFAIVADIASRDPRLADQLESALAKPFAVLLLNEERLQTRYKIATYLDQSRLEDAIRALEPYVPWRRGLLSRRARLYEATRDPRAARARDELELFLKYEKGSGQLPESSGTDLSASEP